MNTTSNSSHVKLMENIEHRLNRYRAKRIRFLINGDKLFSGINYALNTEKVRSLDALLNELTHSLSMDHIKVCKGVRYIFSSDGVLVSSLNDFQDGNTYICSSNDTFLTTEYRISNGMLNWLVRNSACISSSSNVTSSRAKRQIINHNNSCGNHSSANKTLLTPATEKTSHNRSSSSSSANNGVGHVNFTSHANSQTKTPKSLHNNGIRSAPNSATVACKSPKKTNVDRISNSHNNHRNTPKTRTQKIANDSDDACKRIDGTQSSKQKTFTTERTQNNLTETFGLEIVEKYDIGQPIGDGHFSVVYCCMNKTNQKFCALKLIDKDKCRGREDMIYNEVRILKQLNHPNIVKLIEEFDYSRQLYLILELVQDGDLFDAISTVTRFSEVHVATMIHNLSSALSYLHKRGIVHRDIKPENLLISVQEDGSQSVKLADFGLAVEVGDSPLHSVCGTAFYVSPEMLNESGYDYKVDVWSTGVICFILLCGYPPFTSENESNQDELFDAILAGDFQFAPAFWNKISQHAKNLIKCMLTVNPEQRFTAEQVFKHPWTTGISSNFEGIDPMNISRRIALQSH